MTVTREDKVRQFLEAAGKKPWDKDLSAVDWSFLNGFLEETYELKEAMEKYINRPTPSNREELCKEWADVQIVLSNLAVYFDIPASAAFNRVHQNNMTKIGPDGTVTKRADGKILKPDNYVKPDMSGL